MARARNILRRDWLGIGRRMRPKHACGFEAEAALERALRRHRVGVIHSCPPAGPAPLEAEAGPALRGGLSGE